ncbi:MAG TPA: hypothetical protein VJG30_01385 [Candidatus Nanoarchaeia archaeon]|nr:hypothetical protein [Candidatus Nanoarchaeia archaeon]
MRHDYKGTFLESFKDIKNNPILLVPDLLLVISTTVLTSLFLYINGLLKGTTLNAEHFTKFAVETFNSAPLLTKFILSLVILAVINIFFGITFNIMKYVMIRDLVEYRREPNILESYYEVREYLFPVLGIKAILVALYLLPFIVFTFLSLKNNLLIIISPIVVLGIWAFLKVSFLFIYPTLMIKTRKGIITTFRETYQYFKRNRLHALICAAIVFLTSVLATYLLTLIGKLITNYITISSVASLYTLISTLAIIIIWVWGLVFLFKNY